MTLVYVGLLILGISGWRDNLDQIYRQRLKLVQPIGQ
jgi:hypothetical protein